MTKEEFIKKYEDRLAGIAVRGLRTAVAYSGDAAQEGRAIKNTIRAAEEIINEIADDLFPAPATPKAPAIHPGRRA